MTGIQFRGLVYHRKVNCMRIRREDYLEGHGDLQGSRILYRGFGVYGLGLGLGLGFRGL